MKALLKNNVLIPDASNPAWVIPVGTQDWYRWLAENTSFVYESGGRKYNARKEILRGCAYWYAYRRWKGRLRKVYLGKSTALCLDKLIATERKFCELEETSEMPTGEISFDTYTPPLRSITHAVSRAGEAPSEYVPFSLKTRIIPPAMPDNLVPRMHLIQQIRRPITLISAPSGFGKTTLLGQWRAEQMKANSDGHSSNTSLVAWISYDSEEPDVYAFWATVVAALRQIDPKIGESIFVPLHSLPHPPVGFFLSQLIEDLNRWQESQSGCRLALIIDDFHMAVAPAIHESSQYFLDHLPPSIQVVLTSQAQFPFSVHHWQARGILTQLSADELRFSPEECLAWMDQAVSIPLTEREKLSLALLAEGWAAGLNLVMLALGDQQDVHQFLATFEGYHPFLEAFFVEDILKKQEPDRLAFMLKISILDSMTGPLCDAVISRTGSDQLLQQLYQDNLFTTLVDNDKGVYRYHDLFTQALRHQLQLHFDQEIPDLHRRAAVWYQEHGAYAEAIRHLLQIGPGMELEQTIEQVILEELRNGSDHGVLRWLQQLSDELFMCNDNLLITYARLAMPSLPKDQVDNLLNRVRSRIQALSPSDCTPVQQAALARLENWEATVVRGMPIDPPPSGAPLIEQFGYQLDLQYEAYCCKIREGKLAEGEALLRRVVGLARAQGNVFVNLFSGGVLASLLVSEGRLREAERQAREALNYALEQTGTLASCASIALTNLGKICYARNQLAQARQYIDEAVKLDPHPTSMNIVMHHHLLLAFLLNAQDNQAAALTTLQAAIDLQPFATQAMGVQDLKICQALLYLRQGQAVLAEQILREVSDYPLLAGQSGGGLLRMAWAELFLALKQYSQAEELLSIPGSVNVSLSTFDVPSNIRLLLALAYWEQHKFVKARQEMLQIIRQAEPEKIIRPFLDCGERILPLLADLLHLKNLGSQLRWFIELLFEQFQAVNTDLVVLRQDGRAEWSAEVLTPREREVLKMLDEGLNNLAIMRRLAVSESTIRTHLRSIYRKLGVDSRIWAVKRAQELGFV